MSNRAVRSRPEFVVLLALALAAPLLLTCWVHGDGIGYVAMLRSVVVDRDLELADEFTYLPRHIQSDAAGFPARFLGGPAASPGLDPVYHTPAPDPATGRVPAHFSVGPPLAWLPAYLLADRLARTGDSPRGYGGLYYFAIGWTSLALGIAGLVLAVRLVSRTVPGGDAACAVLAMAWASPLLYYLYLAPSYSHAISVFAASAFLLHGHAARGSDRTRTWLAHGALASALFLVRWSDVVLAIPLLALEGWTLARRDARRALACVAVAVAGFAMVAWPQFAVWQVFHGRPWVRHPGPYVGFHLEGLWGTFLSDRHGLFVWTPITMLATWGLVRWWRTDRVRSGTALAAVALLALANASVADWWGGSAFGMRRMIAATPLFALGLAVLFADLRAAWTRRGWPGAAALFPAGVLAFAGWNALLLVQYALGTIPHDAPVSLARMARQQPEALERLGALLSQVAR